MNHSLLTYQEALQKLEETILPLTPMWVSWLDCRNAVLAEDVDARENLPAFDHSAVDGYAVRAEEIHGASPENPVILPIGQEIFAGDPISSSRMPPGHVSKIMTGAPIPLGADAVVMVENTQPVPQGVKILSPIQPKANVRFRGEEIREGDRLLESGTRLGGVDRGLLASQGILEVRVRCLPNVALMVSGNELVDPGEPRRPGQIRNANTYTLAAELEEFGCPVVNLGIARDDLMDIRSKIEAGLEQAQVLITVGGVSAGEKDFIPGILDEMGMHTVFHRLNVRPGKPLLFGLIGEKMVFGLPGNVVSALSSYHLFVKPALRLLTGRMDWKNPVAYARMSMLMHNPGQRTFFVRCRLSPTPTGLPLAIPFEGQGSGMLTSMRNADGFVVIPSDLETVDEFEVVEFIPLHSK